MQKISNEERLFRKSVIGKNGAVNTLLVFKIIFDLIPQVLLVYMIRGLAEKNFSQKPLIGTGVIMTACFALKEICNYLSVRFAHDKAYGSLTELRLRIIEHLKKLPLGFFKEHSAGELTNIIQHDVDQAEIYLAHGLPEIMSAILMPLLIFCAMFFVHWKLALVMITGVPLMFLVKTLSAKAMTEGFRKYFTHESKMREELMEYVKNISVIKAFAKEETVSGKTLKTAREYVHYVKQSMGTVTVPMSLIDIFMEAGVVMVMITGSLLLVKGMIDMSNFILAVILSAAFTAAIGKTATLQHFSVVFDETVKSIGKILFTPLPKNKKYDSLKTGDIVFENVSFEYKKDGFKLNGINLTIKENSLTAFAGASGCGKSTAANLLMGFWQPDSGSVTIGGNDISQYSQESISELIGSVQQDIILFNASIFDNIAIGKTGATEKEIIDAAKKARIHDFIRTLPQGYDTICGEMGVKLSGGEKQRISIARMILKNAPILILDEAMAAVDSENERLISEAVEELRKNKTVITIAHNLNTIINADQIVVMDNGKIIDMGKHNELLDRCIFYKNMTEAQNKVDKWNINQYIC